MKDKIIFEFRAIESEEENESKNAVSSDDESILYSRRDSQESNASSASKQSDSSQDTAKVSVDELTDQFNETVSLADNEETDVDSITDKLQKELSLATEDDLQERQPERHPSHYQNRNSTYPYQQTRNVNHFSGGSVSQNERLNLNYGQLQPPRVASPPQLVDVNLVDQNELVVLDGGTVSDFFNNMPPLELDLEPSQLFNNLPPGPESTNIAVQVPPEPLHNFTPRQETPPHSSSPGSTPSYLSSDVFSPQSNFSSDTSQSLGSPHNNYYDAPSTSRLSHASTSPQRLPIFSPQSNFNSSEITLPIGSPQNSFYDAPSTSGLSYTSNSPQSLPTTLPNSGTSDEEEDLNQEGTTQLRNLIDNEMKEIKMHEWIAANVKELDVLFSELHKLLCKNTRLNDRKLVKIYAIISSILKQNGNLRQFFKDEQNIISHVALKNHPLLLKYIIETMQNLRLTPKDIGESPATILKKVIEQNQDMREVLKILLSLKTKTGSIMFDMNEIDENRLTAVHHVLLKIKQMADPEMKNLAISYLKIFLEHRPDFTLTTMDGRTYLHHAIVWGCGPLVIEKILHYCAVQHPAFDLVDQNDASGVSALRLAANLLQERKEIEEVLQRYMFDVDQNILDLLKNI